MKWLQYLFFFFFLSCTTKDKKKKINPTTYNNIAVITVDSCRKWKLPITAFKVEYPDSYRPLYHARNNYLTLTKFSDSGYVQQEFSFGKNSGYQTQEELIKNVYKADSILSMVKTYKRTFIGFKTLANKKQFLLEGIINFDLMGETGYQGDYIFLATLSSSDIQPNGISISFLNKDSTKLYKETNEILNTLRFIKK